MWGNTPTKRIGEGLAVAMIVSPSRDIAAVGERTALNDLFKLIRDNLTAHGVSAETQPVYQDFRAGDVRHSLADVSKAQGLLGCAPTHRLAQGVEVAMPWYVNQARG